LAKATGLAYTLGVGLLGDSFKAMRMKDPVDGTAQVVASTQPPDSATSSNVNLNLVVQAEGIEATSVELSCIAPTKKWPFPGTTLPVTVDRADPERVKVRWDDVPDHDQTAKQQADALAAQMNHGAGVAPGVTGAGGGDVNQIVEALKQAYPDAQVNVQGGDASALAGATGATSGGGHDHVAQLERLAKLKESGALTDAEFEREKAKILGS
jgi:Short C-terminal domain